MVDVVAWEVEVCSRSLVQPPVPHVAEMLCPPVFCRVFRLPDILFPALVALHDVHDVLVLAGVVSGQLHSSGRGGGLDHLGLPDVGTGAAWGATFPHTPEHSQDCPLRSGRGWRRQLGSDQFISDVWWPLVGDKRREGENLLHLGVGDHRPPVFFHQSRDAGQARMVVHHEHWSVGSGWSLHLLQGLCSGDFLSLLYRGVNNGGLVVPGEEEVLQFLQSLVSRLRTGTDSHYPQRQTVRDVLRMLNICYWK